MMSPNSNEIRLLIAADLHGSNACFKKVVALACAARVDAILLAGDLSGKELILLSEESDGFSFCDSEGRRRHVEAMKLDSTRREWGDRGLYSAVCLNGNNSEVSSAELMSRAKERRLRQWLEFARGKLEPQGIRLFAIPGNDDSSEIVEELARPDSWVEVVDDAVGALGPYEVSGLGYSNITPWETFRELTESELEFRLNLVASRLSNPRRSLLLIHVPPHGSGLDLAPELERDEFGSLEVVPGGHKEVGSEAVHQFILEFRPLLVASGHCHDSQGFRTIGTTLCVNPGSAYQSGTLNAAIVVIEGEKVVGHQLLVR